MRIIVKGQELNTPYKPILRDNLNYVAIQDIVDAVGRRPHGKIKRPVQRLRLEIRRW